MFSVFYPDAYVEDVFSINYKDLYIKGYRGLIFDIDNTLVKHGGDSTSQVDELFSWLHEIGFVTILLSNNSERRIQRFNKNIQSEFVAAAEKPNPLAFLRAVEMTGCRKEECVVVGDQMFTDIRGANRAGIKSVLVKYIGFYKKEWKGFHRNMERVLLWFYKRSRQRRQTFP